MHKVSYASLQAGQRFVGPGRTLTETDHGMFMMLVGDWGALHSDAEYAKTTQFGQRLMHGGFGVALALGMQARLLDFEEPVVGALGLKDWAFKNPLFIGDTVHTEIEILGKRVTSTRSIHRGAANPAPEARRRGRAGRPGRRDVEGPVVGIGR